MLHVYKSLESSKGRWRCRFPSACDVTWWKYKDEWHGMSTERSVQHKALHELQVCDHIWQRNIRRNSWGGGRPRNHILHKVGFTSWSIDLQWAASGGIGSFSSESTQLVVSLRRWHRTPGHLVGNMVLNGQWHHDSVAIAAAPLFLISYWSHNTRVDARFGNNYHQPYPTDGFSALFEGTALTPLCPEDLHHPPPEQGVVWPPAPGKDHQGQKGGCQESRNRDRKQIIPTISGAPKPNPWRFACGKS